MDRAKVLRDRIAVYRRRLEEGLDSEQVRTYLREIAKAQAALDEIEKDSDKRE
jgi:hypothetical protein